jgi:hypothetical protein
MIKYCLGLLLMGCTAIGPRVPDPPMLIPVVAPPDVAAAPKKEPARSKHSHHKCNESFENKRQEFMYKLDCLIDGTGGA